MANKLNFWERAAMLGHSIEDLKAGKAVTSEVVIDNMAQFKRFVEAGMTPQQMEELAQDLFGNIPATDPKTHANECEIIRRVEGYLYGVAPLYEEDEERTKHIFPMVIGALSQETFVVDKGYDLGTGGNLGVVNHETMEFRDGGYYVLYNKGLTFMVDTLIRNGGGAGEFYDINILGATGATGDPGSQPSPGGGGTGGKKGTCRSPGIAGNNGETGERGLTGVVGGAGGTGNDGRPSLGATITISKGLTGSKLPLQIYTRSGAGGPGGAGGKGATGGPGGRGGDGETCGCQGTNGGPGGPGGHGGTGGTGGAGGNGVDASANIVVIVPEGQTDRFVGVTASAPAGKGGNGGPGGGAGGGAEGGAGGKHHSSGGKGPIGSGGTGGNRGADGTKPGNPARIIARQG
jgi:hypothetical protein